MRFDGLVEEVDRAQLVSLEQPVLIARSGRDEHDGDVPRALGAPHQLRELEAVQLRHLHVDERERDVVDQKQLERLRARARLQELHIVATEQGRQREQVLLHVVDQQAFHPVFRHAPAFR